MHQISSRLIFRISLLGIALLALALFARPNNAEGAYALYVPTVSRGGDISISLELFVSGFSSPVDIANAGDDRLFVVEQSGFIYI